jgi:predicted transcriptional regulator
MNKSNHGMIASRKNTPVNIRAEAKEEAFKQVNRIASTMEHMKVSPAEVAKVTGLSRQTVYRVISGTPAKLETVIAIDKAVSEIVKSRMQAVSMLIDSGFGDGSRKIEYISSV